MAGTKNDKEIEDLRKSLQSLFQTETRALIAWNLIIYKELTVKQFVKLMNKDASTITRNLSKMLDLNLVQISKTETNRNFNLNYWRLNPEIPIHKFGDFETAIKNALLRTDLIFMKTALLAIQRNLENILNYKTRKIAKFIQNLFSGKEFISVGMMDEETGALFRKELNEFIFKFQEDNKINLLPIDKIGPGSYFTFLLASQFPSLKE
ncbi:MAG: hypothetical protein ACFFB2_08160 [Promethearchaeota archaeon]